MDPDQTAPIGSSLIRVHIVCFHEKVKSEVHLSTSQQMYKADIFHDKNSGGIRVSFEEKRHSQCAYRCIWETIVYGLEYFICLICKLF